MLAGRPILVVEDDADTRAMLTHRLGEDFGVPVAAAGTLQEAETLLSDESVCIGAMILDVGMPDGDGCDFCARMRREGHKMPIIVLTASDGEEDIIHGLEAGANDYIVKPFVPTNCLHAFAHICAPSRAATMRHSRLDLTFSTQRGSCYSTRSP